MNPWKIIGWIVLAFLLLVIYACVRVASNIGDTQSASSGTADYSAAATPSAPSYSAKVINFSCEQRGRYDVGKATIVNTGASEIPYAKLFVEFIGKDGSVVATGDSYFSPTTIPPGATASADVMERSTGAATCRPGAMQDGDGNPIAYTAQ